MANLTTEDLTKALGAQTEHFTGILDTAIAKQSKEFKTFVKQSIEKESKNIREDLRAFITQENENLAHMVAKGFEDLEKRLDVKDRLEKLEKEFAQLKQALRV